MERAKNVLVTISKVAQHPSTAQKWKYFLNYILAAVNNDAMINSEQVNFLNLLIHKHFNDDPSMVEAATVATWINSCH